MTMLIRAHIELVSGGDGWRLREKQSELASNAAKHGARIVLKSIKFLTRPLLKVANGVEKQEDYSGCKWREER